MITIEEFKKKQSETSRLFGLDLGSKRIGVSICDERQSVATPFKTINKVNNQEYLDHDQLFQQDSNQPYLKKLYVFQKYIFLDYFY